MGSDCNARIDLLEELRWLEYSQRLRKLRRGMAVESSPACTAQKDCAKELFRYATQVGASSLGLSVGSIAKGHFADFATIDLASPLLSGLLNDDIIKGGPSLLPAIIFGGCASSLVKRTCVGGCWSALPPLPRSTSKEKTISEDDTSTSATGMPSPAAKRQKVNGA